MCDDTLWQYACTQSAFQAGVAAPRLAFANLHVLCSEKKWFLAMSLALTELSRRRTRSFKAVFFIGLRPSLRSARSIALNRFLNQPQNRSTGFKSGDRGGMWSNSMCFDAWALATTSAFRKDSLSQSRRHGPRLLSGLSFLQAATTRPSRTAATRSSLATFFVL